MMRAVKLASTVGMSRENWLDIRRSNGIGGSDAAAICGLNPWKSAVQVWLEKTGQVREEDMPSEAAYWGTQLESLVADEFKRRNGLNVQRRHAIFQHPEHPWMLANIDRIIISKEHGNGILEVKTTSEYGKDEWGEDTAPQQYVIQCLHYIAVLGLNYAWLAVLIGGNKYRQIRVERDDEAIAALIDLESRFWQHVEKGIPPAFDGSEASTALLGRLYSEGRPEEIELPPDAKDLVREYEEAAEYERQWAERKEAARNQLCGLLGEYERGRIGDRLVRWSTVRSTRLNVKALRKAYPDVYEEFAEETTSRRFSIR